MRLSGHSWLSRHDRAADHGTRCAPGRAVHGGGCSGQSVPRRIIVDTFPAWRLERYPRSSKSCPSARDAAPAPGRGGRHVAFAASRGGPARRPPCLDGPAGGCDPPGKGLGSHTGDEGMPVMADVLVTAPSRPKVQIIPLRGLPVVAVVFAGLVATIASNKLWPLVFYHVVGGSPWPGTRRRARRRRTARRRDADRGPGVRLGASGARGRSAPGRRPRNRPGARSARTSPRGP